MVLTSLVGGGPHAALIKQAAMSGAIVHYSRQMLIVKLVIIAANVVLAPLQTVLFLNAIGAFISAASIVAAYRGNYAWSAYLLASRCAYGICVAIQYVVSAHHAIGES